MRTTEQSSRYDNLDMMSTNEILTSINKEDMNVPLAVAKAIPQIERLVEGIVERMPRGGRVFYLGAGTSGRLQEVILPSEARLKERKMIGSKDGKIWKPIHQHLRISSSELLLLELHLM